jgi:hypothetical protein
MIDNPWDQLPESPPFVLPDDRDKVLAFNKKQEQKGSDHLLNLDVLPMPFIGCEDAPVVLLGNIAGAGDSDLEDYTSRPEYADRMRKNLVHQNKDFPFYPMAPAPVPFPSHRDWWRLKLKYLLAELQNGKEADESILAKNLLAVEFFPYRSRSSRYSHDKLSLPSQKYSCHLVSKAMENKAVIIVRYGRHRWERVVNGLARYSHLVTLKGTQRTYISRTGTNADGFQKILDRITASAT